MNNHARLRCAYAFSLIAGISAPAYSQDNDPLTTTDIGHKFTATEFAQWATEKNLSPQFTSTRSVKMNPYTSTSITRYVLADKAGGEWAEVSINGDTITLRDFGAYHENNLQRHNTWQAQFSNGERLRCGKINITLHENTDTVFRALDDDGIMHTYATSSLGQDQFLLSGWAKISFNLEKKSCNIQFGHTFETFDAPAQTLPRYYGGDPFVKSFAMR